MLYGNEALTRKNKKKNKLKILDIDISVMSDKFIR